MAKHAIDSKNMVATAPRRGPGRPRSADPAARNITFRAEQSLLDALDKLPNAERRGFIRRVVKKALQKRGLLDRAGLAG